jgi:hypothetical protein
MADFQGLTNTLQGIKNRYASTGAGAGDRAYQEMTNYLRQNNIDPNMAAQAATSVSGENWDANRVQQTMAQYPGARHGLNPAMDTLGMGANAATQRIDQTQGMVGDIYKRGIGYLDPYMQTGKGANQQQAALSGALGPEAQKAAYAQYQQSPGVAFAQAEAERALKRNASALGGLGGGNIMRDLSQLAAGTYMQDYNNQFQQLGQVADRGYGAATTGAGLEGQQAGIQADLGKFAANIPLQTAMAQSGMQFQAGRDIGQAAGNTSSALAQLLQQQGAGMADITQNNTNNLNALYQNALNGDAQSKEQLAQMLSNLGMQGAGGVSGQPMIPGFQSNYLGQLGQVAGGVGGLFYGLNAGQNQQQYMQPTGNFYNNVNPQNMRGYA